MIHFDRRIRLPAAYLSALAGYVDALAFLKLGGFFVSFISGNSTRLGDLGSVNVHAVFTNGRVAKPSARAIVVYFADILPRA